MIVILKPFAIIIAVDKVTVLLLPLIIHCICPCCIPDCCSKRYWDILFSFNKVEILLATASFTVKFILLLKNLEREEHFLKNYYKLCYFYKLCKLYSHVPTSAQAQEAIPLPSPTIPSFSVVVALIFIVSFETPSERDKQLIICGI